MYGKTTATQVHSVYQICKNCGNASCWCCHFFCTLPCRLSFSKYQLQLIYRSQIYHLEPKWFHTQHDSLLSWHLLLSFIQPNNSGTSVNLRFSASVLMEHLLLDRGCLVSVTSLEQRYALRSHDGTWHLFSLRERAIVFLDSSWEFQLSPPLAVVASKDSLNLFPGFAPSHFWLGFHSYMITILILITCKNVWFDFGGKLKTFMSGLTRSISLSVCDYGLKKASGFWKRGDSGFMRVRFIEVPLY